MVTARRSQPMSMAIPHTPALGRSMSRVMSRMARMVSSKSPVRMKANGPRTLATPMPMALHGGIHDNTESVPKSAMVTRVVVGILSQYLRRSPGQDGTGQADRAAHDHGDRCHGAATLTMRSWLWAARYYRRRGRRPLPPGA